MYSIFNEYYFTSLEFICNRLETVYICEHIEFGDRSMSSSDCEVSSKEYGERLVDDRGNRSVIRL